MKQKKCRKNRVGVPMNFDIKPETANAFKESCTGGGFKMFRVVERMMADWVAKDNAAKAALYHGVG